MKRLVLYGISLYQLFVSPLFPQSCRFYPSCSSYMKEAIEKKGLVKGLFSGFKRILRCHPLNPGGYDPVG